MIEKEIYDFLYDNINSKEELEIFLPKIIKNNPKISKFTFISNKNIINFDIKPLKEALQGLQLESLILIGNESEENGFSFILKCFEKTNFQNLSLEHLQVDDEFLKYISSNQNLQKLNFSFSKINFKYVGLNRFSFKSLEISSSDIKYPSIFYEMILINTSLEELNLINNSMIYDFKKLFLSLNGRNLAKLRLSHINMCENPKYFINVISLPTKELKLERITANNIKDVPVFKYLNTNLLFYSSWDSSIIISGIDTYLEKNQNIETLSIIFDIIGKDGYLIAKGISKNNSLRKLVLNNVKLSQTFPQLVKSIMNNHRLLEIDFSNNGLRDDDCSLISSYLSQNPYLKILILCGNLISDQGVQNLFKSLLKHNTLKRLDLSNNSLENDSCFILKDLIKSNSNLETLQLQRPKFNHIGLKCLSEALQYNTNLNVLDLYMFNDNKSKDDFLNLLYFNTSVTELELSGTPNEELKLKYILQRNSGFVKTLKFPRKGYDTNFIFK